MTYTIIHLHTALVLFTFTQQRTGEVIYYSTTDKRNVTIQILNKFH